MWLILCFVALFVICCLFLFSFIYYFETRHFNLLEPGDLVQYTISDAFFEDLVVGTINKVEKDDNGDNLYVYVNDQKFDFLDYIYGDIKKIYD